MPPVGTPDEVKRGRLRAVALLTQGHPRVEVAHTNPSHLDIEGIAK